MFKHDNDDGDKDENDNDDDDDKAAHGNLHDENCAGGEDWWRFQ